MSNIFVSYRRKDAPSVVGRLIDRLELHFGKKHIFRDMDSINYGQDFGTAINQALERCEVMLVVIGEEWVNVKNDSGARRIDNPDDWVRIEVSKALHKRIPVIPLLVENARMPSEEQLPDELRALAQRNAATIRVDPDFNNDVEKLVNAIKQYLNLSTGGKSGLKSLLILLGINKTTGIIVGLIVVLVMAYLVINPASPCDGNYEFNLTEAKFVCEQSSVKIDQRGPASTQTQNAFNSSDISVKIYWHRDGFSESQAKKLAKLFKAAGAQTEVDEHVDPHAPDALFIGNSVGANLARIALLNTPYNVIYLFRPDYPENDGSMSEDGRAIGIGYRSTHYEEDRTAKAEPLRINQGIINYLTEPGISDTEFQSRLKAITGS